jgi:hypothetical protein
MKQRTVSNDTIVDEYQACVYCGDEWTSRKDYLGCCGEIHSELVYVLDDGEHVRAEEVVIVEEVHPLDDETMLELEFERQFELKHQGDY